MYPDAQLIGVEGLPSRKKKEGLTFDHIFDPKNNSKSFGPEGEVKCRMCCVKNRSNVGIFRAIRIRK
jgi:hypothetical protein